MKSTILFVDDEPAIVRSLAAFFDNDANVLTAESGKQAIDVLKGNSVNVIVSDQRMPHMTGIEVLKRAQEISPNTTRILLTGYADLTATVGSINEGEVFRYINKPWDQDELKRTVMEAAEISTVTMESVKSKPEPASVRPDKPACILVIDDGRESYEAVKTMFNGFYSVFSASSVEEAMQILEQQPVSIILTELKVSSDDMTDFIKALKQHHPSILTLVQTNITDAHNIIELINRGRVYRLLLKPIRHQLLKLSIERAMKTIHSQHINPVIIQQQRVAKTSNKLDIAPSILLRLRARLLKGSE